MRAVDGEHVGLDGDGGDRLDDLVDAPRHELQVLHLLDAGLRLPDRRGDADDQLVDRLLVHGEDALDVADLLGAARGTGLRDLDALLDLVDRGRRFLGRRRGGLRAPADLLDRPPARPHRQQSPWPCDGFILLDEGDRRADRFAAGEASLDPPQPDRPLEAGQIHQLDRDDQAHVLERGEHGLDAQRLQRAHVHDAHFEARRGALEVRLVPRSVRMLALE